MMMFQGEVREHPLVKTSSKSNIGHTELCAGICGIIKCVLMGVYCDACPNNHIRLLNPHIDSNAYPVYFCTESVDQGKNQGFGGVSSFGFGGSNARGDIWARALAGPRNTDPGTRSAWLSANRIFIWGEVCKQARPRLPPSAAENALDIVQDYDDAYMVGEQPGDDDELFVVGSFNGWTKPEKMTYVEEFGSYIFAMPLGEACIEQFQICMNKNEYFKIFPASKFSSSQDTIVLGPGIAPVGNNWVIDGRPQGLPQGTLYHISLQWELETRKKIVTWEPSLDEYVTELASQIEPFRHRYCVLGSWSGFKPVEMLPARGEKPGTFETAVRVGFARHEEFRFQRDSDRLQTIYPARQRDLEANATPMWAWTQAGIKAIAHDADRYGNPQVGSAFTPDHFAVACKGDLKIDTVAVPGSKAWNDQSKIFEAMKAGGSVSVDAPGKDGPIDLEGLGRLGLISNSGSESVPACGPDHLGEEKNWTVSGVMGESFKIMLRVWDSEITVTTINSRTGIRTWTNQQAAMRRKYFVTATWNNWGFTPMTSEGTDVHWLRVVMPQSQMVAFQIAVDEDKAQAIHPDMALTDQLMSPAMGPDAKGEGLFWGVGVERGMAIEIKLDLSQQDRRKVVTWTYC
uniref:Beta-ketoacyl synthase C-terminal domain-containing protein n=1 Tax=Alexandrium catenella TaxID=2925 RepID=A0A7S1RXA2_ALECA